MPIHNQLVQAELLQTKWVQKMSKFASKSKGLNCGLIRIFKINETLEILNI